MKKIFEEVSLGKLTIKNRLIRSATFEHGGANGVITPFLREVHEELAQGGIGLIITGMMAVGPNSSLIPDMVRVDFEDFVPKYTEISKIIHQYDCKVIVQLSHCGIAVKMMPDGQLPLGPSDLNGHANAMTKAEIKTVVSDFGRAAYKCKTAGADGVQIHGAHGYLISQFLSPYYNKRNDEYGGSIENRARLLFEIFDEILAQVGNEYPVLIKINYSDLVENGLTGDECLWVCKELDKRGIDAIEVSSGLALGRESSPAQAGSEGYFSDGALRLAETIHAPVISIGGYRTPEKIEKFLNEGNLAAISLCRPLVREPRLPAKWQADNHDSSLCISCSQCFLSKQLKCKFNI